MTNCKNCGAPLKVVNGKCAYCGTDYHEPPHEIEFVYAHEKDTLRCDVSVPILVSGRLDQKTLDRRVKTFLAQKLAEKIVQSDLMRVQRYDDYRDMDNEHYVGMVTLKEW